VEVSTLTQLGSEVDISSELGNDLLRDEQTQAYALGVVTWLSIDDSKELK